MTLDDARAIHDGPDDAATRYLQAKMTQPLAAEMRPIVAQEDAAIRRDPAKRTTDLLKRVFGPAS